MDERQKKLGIILSHPSGVTGPWAWRWLEWQFHGAGGQEGAVPFGQVTLLST